MRLVNKLVSTGILLLIIALSISTTPRLVAQTPQSSSINAGSPWEEVPLVADMTFYCIDMLDANTGWAGGTAGGFMQWDGVDWKPYWIATDAAIQGVETISPTEAWAVSAKGDIFHYNGTYWPLDYKANGIWLNGIYMANHNQGWAVGDNGRILTYLNGTWNENGYGDTLIFDDIDMLPDLSDGWIVGGGVIYRWQSARWSRAVTLPGVWLHSVDIVTADDVWAVGGKKEGTNPSVGTIYHFDGSAWTETTAHPQVLQNISMTSEDNGWAVGLDGTILHYDGQAWEQVPSPVDSHLYDVQMLNSEDGWIAGRRSKILRYVGLPADLSPSWLEVSSRKALPADTLTYTIHVNNVGDLPASSVTVTDTIPIGTTYVPNSANASAGTISGPDPVLWTLTDLPSQGESTLTFQVTVDDSPGSDCWFVSNEALIGFEGTSLARSTTTSVGTGCFEGFLPLINK